MDYFVNWYQNHKELALPDSSKLRYQYTISIVMQYFTGRKLNQITRAEYEKFLNDYAHPAGKKKSPSILQRKWIPKLKHLSVMLSKTA
ncbi:hypothetical protein [Secundilactobacillus kimchicus]|uniref:hypothetical protein n=1 Tax=Secundilactobacillus kimchicus TaxID=528209 RepID=UPI0024A8FD7A|nr:hypothetical protein [Secundilactobacillus kimchicus]